MKSTLLIVSDSDNSQKQMEQMLNFYFPSELKDHIIISNKYFSSQINLKFEKLRGVIPQMTTKNQQKSGQVKEQQQLDCIVYLLKESVLKQILNKKQLETLLNQHKSDSKIIFVNSAEKVNTEELKEQMFDQTQLFVDILTENLSKKQSYPERKRCGLLEEESNDIFVLLDFLEATNWSVKQSTAKHQQEDLTIKQQSTKTKAQKLNQEMKQPENQQQWNENNQKKLQAQMQNFETMLSQAMQLRDLPAGQDRKQKAQSLFNQLTKHM